MNYQLGIACRSQPDILERILRVIRHRGFTLEAITMTPAHSGQQFDVAVTVYGQRPLQLLVTQLEKLHDVLKLKSEQN